MPTKTSKPIKKMPAQKGVNPVIEKKENAGLPLSVVIRRRIEAQKARFHANDNISAFIEPGELEGLVEEVAEKMQAVLSRLDEPRWKTVLYGAGQGASIGSAVGKSPAGAGLGSVIGAGLQWLISRR